MKKKQHNSVRASALQITLALGLISLSAILFASSLTSSPGGANASSTTAIQPDTPMPDVVQLIGPVILNTDLRDLPYIAPSHEFEEKRLTRYPHPEIPTPTKPTSAYQRFESLMKQILSPMPQMPGPLLTFDGMNSSQSGCLCLPPDTDGDVGPNHYVQSVNSSIKIFDKNGNPLNGPNGTTYNSFFVTLVGTPCSGFNDGDGFVFYDHVADRWVVSDFAFPGTLPGAGPFYQCIGVSQTGDPVSGGWFLYAIQHDPANPTWIGDYPKFAFWNSGGSPAQNAYYLTINLFDGNMIRPTRRGSAITQSSLSGGTPIISQLTCSMVLLLASKACARLRLTARRCSLVVLPTRSPSTSLRPAWAIRIVWFQLVFAPATRHRWAEMNFYYLSTALLRAA